MSRQHGRPCLRTASQSTVRWPGFVLLQLSLQARLLSLNWCRDFIRVYTIDMHAIYLTLRRRVVSYLRLLHWLLPQSATFAHSLCQIVSVCCLLQVFFCSRTHSQLSQFVSELHRTAFADTIATVALASRKVRLPFCVLLAMPRHFECAAPLLELSLTQAALTILLLGLLKRMHAFLC